jgi:hypothetical protein
MTASLGHAALTLGWHPAAAAGVIVLLAGTWLLRGGRAAIRAGAGLGAAILVAGLAYGYPAQAAAGAAVLALNCAVLLWLRRSL